MYLRFELPIFMHQGSKLCHLLENSNELLNLLSARILRNISCLRPEIETYRCYVLTWHTEYFIISIILLTAWFSTPNSQFLWFNKLLQTQMGSIEFRISLIHYKSNHNLRERVAYHQCYSWRNSGKSNLLQYPILIGYACC